MKYISVVINYDSEGEFVSSEFKTDIGTISVDNEKVHDVHLEKFAKQELMTVEDLKRSDMVTENVDKEDSEDFDDDVYRSSYSKLRRKQAIKKWLKRFLATVTTIVVLGTGTYLLDKHKKVLDGKFYAFFHPDKKIESQVNGQSFRNDDTSVDTIITNNANNQETFSTYVISDDSSEYDKNLAGVIARDTQVSQNIRLLSSQTVVELSEEDIFTALNDKLLSGSASLLAVSNYINGEPFNGNGYICDFENDFVNENDYVIVSLFSQGRNAIVTSAFRNESRDSIKEMIRKYYEFFEKFAILGETCSFELNGKSYNLNFEDLSDVAKLGVIELGDAMLMINCDYSNRFEIISKIKPIREELVKKVVGQGYRK